MHFFPAIKNNFSDCYFIGALFAKNGKGLKTVSLDSFQIKNLCLKTPLFHFNRSEIQI
jgi:hypothetical protein